MSEHEIPVAGGEARESRERVTLDDLYGLTEHVEAVMRTIKETIHRPDGKKEAPRFNRNQLTKLCGKTPTGMARLLERAEQMGLSAGELTQGREQRRFTQAEAFEWVRSVDGLRHRRTPGQPGAVITVALHKGGVGKTMNSVSLAQALSHKGYRCLLIDADPQGNSTSMLGVSPNLVDIEATVAPICIAKGNDNSRRSLIESVRTTYWSGVDLVASGPATFACDLYLAGRWRDREEGFNMLETLHESLTELREVYDYIIIDTPPAMGMLTMNCYWTADALLVPIVPDGITLESSVQFWAQFSELASAAKTLGGREKEYAWVGVLPSMVEDSKSTVQELMKWIKLCYGFYVMNTSIPRTEVVRVTGAELSTAYDISKYVGTEKTYKRARDAFDNLATEIDGLTRARFWTER
jgi:chromosome partitioning protein